MSFSPLPVTYGWEVREEKGRESGRVRREEDERE